MRNAVVLVGTLLLIGSCRYWPGLDEDPVEYADPVMISLDNARIGLQATTTETASTATRAPGLNAEDAADSLTFRSSDIEFWGIETIDDIDNIYSTTAIRDDRADVNTEIVNVSVQADLGDLHWTFSPNVTDLHFGAGTVVEFPQVVNLIRIDIGAGIMFIEDDGVEIDELYDANGNLMQVVDGGEFVGLNCNSIMLIDKSILPEAIYISREVSLGDNWFWLDEDDLVRDDLAAVYKLMERGESQNIDMDHALFVPLEPIDLSSYSNITEIIVTFSWNIDAAIERVDGQYVMADRTGNGICLDFNVGLSATEETQPSD